MIKVNGKPVVTNKRTVPINLEVNSFVTSNIHVYKPLNIGEYSFEIDSNGCMCIYEGDEEMEEIELIHRLRRVLKAHILSYIYEEKFEE